MESRRRENVGLPHIGFFQYVPKTYEKCRPLLSSVFFQRNIVGGHVPVEQAQTRGQGFHQHPFSGRYLWNMLKREDDEEEVWTTGDKCFWQRFSFKALCSPQFSEIGAQLMTCDGDVHLRGRRQASKSP